MKVFDDVDYRRTQSGSHQDECQQGRRHRLARGSGRDPVGTHQQPHRALQDPREGQSFAPRPFEAGRRRAVRFSITSRRRTRRVTRRCSKSTTFVVEFESTRACCARFRMIFGTPDFALSDGHAHEHDERHAQRSSSSNPAAGRWREDARTTGRMDAIRNIKTMAGSPDADRALRSASRNLAHGLCVSGVRPFVNP